MLVLLAIALLAPAAYANDDADKVFGGRWGFCYPEGYDVNTERIIDGNIIRFDPSERMHTVFEIEAKGRRYSVVTCPKWFWRERGETVSAGEAVRVRGSLAQGRGGGLFIIAAEIERSGGRVSIRLRDEKGMPLWKADHKNCIMGGGMMKGGGCPPGCRDRE